MFTLQSNVAGFFLNEGLLGKSSGDRWDCPLPLSTGGFPSTAVTARVQIHQQCIAASQHSINWINEAGYLLNDLNFSEYVQ